MPAGTVLKVGRREPAGHADGGVQVLRDRGERGHAGRHVSWTNRPCPALADTRRRLRPAAAGGPARGRPTGPPRHRLGASEAWLSHPARTRRRAGCASETDIGRRPAGVGASSRSPFGAAASGLSRHIRPTAKMRHADPHPPGQQDRCANVVSCMAHRNSVVGKTTLDCAKRPLLYPGEGDVARIVGGDVSVQLDGSTARRLDTSVWRLGNCSFMAVRGR